MNDDDFLTEAKERFAAARDFLSPWRQEAREDFAFVAGDQWDPEDMQMLQEQLRPVITFNKIGPTVDSIAGVEVQNRQETKYLPRTMGDVGVNEVLTAAAKWVRDRCDAEEEESDAFLDAVICGLGWTETRLDYDENQDGEIVINRVDPMEMYYDPSSTKSNLADAKWVFRVRELTEDEFEDMFPGKLEEVGYDANDNTEDLDTVQPNINDPGDDYKTQGDQKQARKKIKVFEYHWCEKGDVYRVADPMTQNLAEFPPSKFRMLQERAEAAGVPLKYVKQKKRQYYRAFYSGKTVLEKSKAPYSTGLCYQAITAKRDRNKNQWYGIVRAMKDPQRWTNKWLSQILHIVNSNSKGGLLAESDAFVNPKKAEEEWAKPDAITWIRSGGLAKIKEKDPAQYPSGLDRLMSFAVSSIRDASGVNLEQLGMADRQQSGLVEQTRQAAGMTILAKMFDSLRRYRTRQGRLLLEYIQEYIADGRLIRIVGEEGEKYVPLTKQDGTVEYDVIVDQSPTSQNQKSAVWELIVQMMPILSTQPLPGPIWAELLKYSPLPASTSEKIGQQLNQPPGPDPEMEKLKIQQQTRQFEAESRAKEREVDQQLKAHEAQMKQAEFQVKMEELRIKQRELAMAEYEKTADIQKTEAETGKILAEIGQIKDQSMESMAKVAQALQSFSANMENSRQRKLRVVRDENGDVVGAEYE